MRREACAMTIQLAWRRHMRTKEAEKRNTAAITIQKNFKMYKHRKHYLDTKRLNEAAVR